MITENDPAGMGIAFTNAINRYTDHSCRLITKTTRYNFDFEKDLHVPDLNGSGFDEIAVLLRAADIFHFHILSDESLSLGTISVKDYIKNKAILHHHHGHPDFRSHPKKYQEKYRRLKRKVLVSTPDLLRLLPEAKWQPNLVPIYDHMLLPKASSASEPVRIGQSVTRKDLKNTKDLEGAVAELQGKDPAVKVSLDIIENTAYRECLRQKNNCHIIFDHMQGYYGVSSLESLSQGKPVIAGLDEWNIRHIKEFTGVNHLPWIIARNRNELRYSLKNLTADEEQRKHIGHESRIYMENYWTENCVLDLLFEIYRSL